MRSSAGPFRVLPPFDRRLVRARIVVLTGTFAITSLIGYGPLVQAGEQRQQSVLLVAPRSVGVTPGETLSIPLSAFDPVADGPLRVMLDEAPFGVELTRNGEHDWLILWPTPTDLDETLLAVTATVRDAPSRRSRVEIEVRALPDAVSRPFDDTPVDALPWASSNDRQQAHGGLASAPAALLQLPEVAPQQLLTGRPWSLWLRPEGARAEATLTFGLRGAPRGLSSETMSNGWTRLRWTPTTSGVIDLDVVALDDGEPMIEARRRLRLEVGDAIPEAPATLPGQGTRTATSELPMRGNTMASGMPATDAGIPAVAPHLPALSHQVVSPGRVVRFKVRPDTATGQRALVQIDRLPRNASFDENSDGSRTFYWLTGDRDQGEHRFRLTAIDAEEPSLRDTSDVIVTVGDPSRGKTVPAE